MAATFGVDETLMGYRCPHIDVSATAKVTSASLLTMIGSAANTVGGMLRHVGIDPSSAEAETTTDMYGIIQDLIAENVEIRMHGAAYGKIPIASELRDWKIEAKETLDGFKVSPSELGEVDTTAVAPRASSSTVGLGLDTSEDSRRARRTFDGANYRSTSPNDIYRN